MDDVEQANVTQSNGNGIGNGNGISGSSGVRRSSPSLSGTASLKTLMKQASMGLKSGDKFGNIEPRKHGGAIRAIG